MIVRREDFTVEYTATGYFLYYRKHLLGACKNSVNDLTYDKDLIGRNLSERCAQQDIAALMAGKDNHHFMPVLKHWVRKEKWKEGIEHEKAA